MSVKRRDHKNRILRNGESQRPDGRYVYVYLDAKGKQRFLYSWKLEKTDKIPQGKRDGLSLREKVRFLEQDLRDGIVFCGGDITVMELVQKYISQKTGVRHNTETGYRFVVGIIAKEAFGQKRIDKVKLSDAKAWLIKLQASGKGYSTICAVKGVVKPAFQMAVDDDLIRKNPFDFPLTTIVINDSVTREAITKKEEREFLEFIKEDKHFSQYYDAIYILLNTGLRISEFTGLVKSDIDFKNGRIKVERQLLRTRNMEYVIETTKTASGIRYIPMTDGVKDCFKRIISGRRHVKEEPEVGGYTGFLFLDKNNMPMVALHWEKYFQHIREKYDRTHKEPLPKITPHVCRHTFCSNMAKSGMNPKILQYIMGHSDISTTLNTYTHVRCEDAMEEMKRMPIY